MQLLGSAPQVLVNCPAYSCIKLSLLEAERLGPDGWYSHTTYWDPFAIRAVFGVGTHTEKDSCSTAEMWLEASPGCHPHVEVLNTAVDFSNVFSEQLAEEQHVWVMSVLARAVSDSISPL